MIYFNKLKNELLKFAMTLSVEQAWQESMESVSHQGC